MSDERDSVERDEIHKDDDVTLIDIDEESEEIYNINRKEQDVLESDKSETYERYQIEISDLLKMFDSQKKQTMMICHTDIDIEKNDEESEEKQHIEENKEDNLESDKSGSDERYQRENQELFKNMDSQKKGDDDDLVDTDID